MKLPYIAWYVGDWRKDPGVQALNYHDRGVWFEILCLMHESSERGKLIINGAPLGDDLLARLLGLDRQVLTQTLDSLLAYGVASRCVETGALMSRRMVRDEHIRRMRAECGAMGGNPALLKPKARPRDRPPVKSKPEPSLQLCLKNEDELFPAAASCASRNIFEDFWAAYPKKKARGSAEKAWSKLKDPRRMLPVILEAIRRQKRGRDWQKDSGQFIPYPATWLNNQGWLDEPTSLAAPVRPSDPLPAWLPAVDEIRRLLPDAAMHRDRLVQLAQDLPKAAWAFLKGDDYNTLNRMMKERSSGPA